MFRPSFFGLIFAGLCTQSAAFRKTWNSDRQPDKPYSVENATEDATEAAESAKWYLHHVYKRASDAAGYGATMAQSCSEEAKTQWQALNFILGEDKKNGHVYLRCKVGDPKKKFKVACLPAECTPDASPMPQVPGQREWCFVSSSCGGIWPCSPLAKNIPDCPADLIDSFAPEQKEPENAPENAPGTCPDSCHSPTCLRGSSSNGGVPVFEGKCLKYASKLYKDVRYCGWTAEYQKGSWVDCTGCAAPEVEALPVVQEVDAELEEDDASAHTIEALPVVQEVDADLEEDAPLDVEIDASAHTNEAEVLEEGAMITPSVPIDVEKDASAHTNEAEVVEAGTIDVEKDASAHTVEEELTVNVPGANNGPDDLIVPERIVEDVVAEELVPDVVVHDGLDQAILEPEHVEPTVVEPKEPTILEPEKPDNNSVPKENLGPERIKTPTTPEASLRLAGAGSKVNSGRLEIFHKGEWGTVCENYWEDAAADVACKQLGYSGGGMLVYNEFGEGSGRIWLDEVECMGQEVSLHKCKHVNWGETLSCEHGQDVALECLCPDCEKEENLPPPPAQPDYLESDIEETHWNAEVTQAMMKLAGVKHEEAKVLQENVEGSFELQVQAKAHDGAPIDGAVFEASDTAGNLIGRSDPTPASGWTTLTSVDDMTIKVTATGCNVAQEAWSVERKCTGGTREGCEMLIVMNCNERVHGDAWSLH